LLATIDTDFEHTFLMCDPSPGQCDGPFMPLHLAPGRARPVRFARGTLWYGRSPGGASPTILVGMRTGFRSESAAPGWRAIRVESLA